jgi:phenylpropionate dioxygenase-like ring-hydroxylating dioxygenase large terminal subunit
LGQYIVVFLDAFGERAALEDRCRHRTAKPSKGWIKNGHIVCGYHGWESSGSRKHKTKPSNPRRSAASPSGVEKPATVIRHSRF